MYYLNSRARCKVIVSRLHIIHISLYHLCYHAETKDGSVGELYKDRQSAMQLDTHYPRIASSKLKLTVCGSLFCWGGGISHMGTGIGGNQRWHCGAEELRKALPLI